MTATLSEKLKLPLARVARVPHLLVACDYDGTLAPLVDDPTRAEPHPEAVAAVRTLAALPQTTVAVISGRSLRDLAALSRLPNEVKLVGSHGSEFDVGFVERIAPELADLRTRLGRALYDLAKPMPGIRLEQKPASVAVHTRLADRNAAAQIIEAVRSGPATWPGVHVTIGKDVMELSVVATEKGLAVDTLRTQNSASAVVYLGDDDTDETAFNRLSGLDIGVRIGAGETHAEHTVADYQGAIAVLNMLGEHRRRWLYGESAIPIERHSMLGNGRTVALLTPSAKVTWLCQPRPDSPAVFAALLGDDSAGYFSVEPANPPRGGDLMPLGQRYRPGSMSVETRWSGLTVTDWLDAENESADTTLVRLLTGSIPVRIAFAPRPEFGQVPTQLRAIGSELRVFGSNEPIALVAPAVTWNIVDEGGHHTAHAVVDLADVGGTLALELRFGGSASTPVDDLSPPEPPQARDPVDNRAHAKSFRERLTATEKSWRVWADTLRLPFRERELVLRSAMTLRALRYSPTGAISAAGTTSLPEEIGGLRNWDYRYCWLRDAAMGAQALVTLGSADEADALLAWTRRIINGTGGHPERLHPLYTVDGYELGAEAVIETLPGYAGSRPVRVGNAANRQVQLDVFGPIADLLAHFADLRGGLDPWHVELLGNMVEAVSRRWHEPDHGIWEARIPPRHHVYSKVMGWLTVDRALRIADRYQVEAQPGWVELRDTIADEVLTRGWDNNVGAYTVAYDHRELDASSLWIGLSGLLADDDPRFLSTVLAIESDLRSGPIVYRYRWDDGLPGREGGFHICSAWMVEAYLRTGRRADAEELFQQMINCAGPTGLLPEQYDHLAERGLGNHPQAYSHIGLINCALMLEQHS
jgi:trehalose-phosphatase